MTDSISSAWQALLGTGIIDPDRGFLTGVALPIVAILAVGWFVLHLLLD
jgi:hypothetical protein